MFQLKKKPPDYQGRKGRKMEDKGLRGKEGLLPPEKLPYLVELSPGRRKSPSSVILKELTSVMNSFGQLGAVQLCGFSQCVLFSAPLGCFCCCSAPKRTEASLKQGGGALPAVHGGRSSPTT